MWKSLRVKPHELRLEKTLLGGQCFRWVKSSENVYYCAIFNRLVGLRETSEDVEYFVSELHQQDSQATITDNFFDESIPKKDDIYEQLHTYFQLKIPLEPLFEEWKSDENFNIKSKGFEGLRVLKQPVFENVISFICSANNNISRISLMINKVFTI